MVTKSVTLQADLLLCAGDGLIVGAPGIRIDLNGHRIWSHVDAGAPMTPGSAGIRNPGFEDVRIEDSQHTATHAGDAEISGFETGILITDADRNTVAYLHVAGLRLERSHNAIIRKNHAFWSRSWGGHCDPLTSTGAIELVDSNGATIRGNDADLALFGVILRRSHNNLLQGNRVAPTGSDGNDCGGIVLLDADKNRLVRNTTANDADGVFVDSASQRTVIDTNYAAFNYDDGIDVENPATTIRNTINNRNRDLGIEAVPGVTASGNTANANTNPLQCLNVTCT